MQAAWFGATVATRTCGALAGVPLPAEVTHVALSECEVHLTRARLRLIQEDVEAAYLPLSVPDGPAAGAMPGLFWTQDPTVLQLLTDAFAAQQRGGEAAWVDAHLTDLVRPIETLVVVSRGSRLSVDDTTFLSESNPPLQSPAVLLRSIDSLPSPALPFALSVLFAALASWALFAPPSGIVRGTGQRDSRPLLP